MQNVTIEFNSRPSVTKSVPDVDLFVNDLGGVLKATKITRSLFGDYNLHVDNTIVAVVKTR